MSDDWIRRGNVWPLIGARPDECWCVSPESGQEAGEVCTACRLRALPASALAAAAMRLPETVAPFVEAWKSLPKHELTGFQMALIVAYEDFRAALAEEPKP